MPTKPVFVGGQNPTSEIPVTGGSLWGTIANLPQTMMSAPGGMFGGKGTAGSPTAPPVGGQPTNPQVPGGSSGAFSGNTGGQPAAPIFGGGGGAPMAGTSSNDTIMSIISKLLGQGGV